MCSLWETVICVFVSPSIKQRLRLPGVGIYHSQLHFCILTGQKSLNHKPICDLSHFENRLVQKSLNNLQSGEEDIQYL